MKREGARYFANTQTLAPDSCKISCFHSKLRLKHPNSVDNSGKTVDKYQYLGKTRSFVRRIMPLLPPHLWRYIYISPINLPNRPQLKLTTPISSRLSPNVLGINSMGSHLTYIGYLFAITRICGGSDCQFFKPSTYPQSLLRLLDINLYYGYE